MLLLLELKALQKQASSIYTRGVWAIGHLEASSSLSIDGSTEDADGTKPPEGLSRRLRSRPSSLLSRQNRSGREGQKDTDAVRREVQWVFAILDSMVDSQALLS